MIRLPLQIDDWAFVAANWEYLLSGLIVTVLLTVTSLGVGFVTGFPAGAVEVYGSGRLQQAVSTLGVILRGTPIVVLIVLFFLDCLFRDSG